MRPGRQECVGRRQRKWHARGRGPDFKLGARARAERTKNMPYMSVTLDVSKLSGWLKGAPCQVKRRACDAGSGTAREV